MTSNINKSKLQELLWVKERSLKQSRLQEKLNEILLIDSYNFLSFEESDKIQLLLDEWPKNKWGDHLYFQTEISNSSSVKKIIESYVKLNNKHIIHLFFMNYNSCLVSISNQVLVDYWEQLLEIDGDEIFISIPSMSHFICVELTEDIIVGKESNGRNWIYEITISNKKLKEKLLL